MTPIPGLRTVNKKAKRDTRMRTMRRKRWKHLGREAGPDGPRRRKRLWREAGPNAPRQAGFIRDDVFFFHVPAMKIATQMRFTSSIQAFVK